ncbi:NAD(P)-dependent oxidoreductase, partial [Candidatus Pelagibacter sp.]|nr:NAD(P)-dependent oxidoreductase [Candidatus Pelagibacter sp.]
MNILFTGCSSYIGKYLITKYLDNGKYNLFGISRTDPKIKNKKFKWFKHDLTLAPFKKLKKIDIVIHIAGAALRKENTYEDYVQGNIFMSYYLGRTAKYSNTKIIFYTSTREVYGEIYSNTLSEKNSIHNPIFYGQTKYLAEQILSASCETISLRLPAVLGKGTHGWISKVYGKMISDESVKFVNCKFNNFIYVDDIYQIINSFLKKKIFITDQF